MIHLSIKNNEFSNNGERKCIACGKTGLDRRRRYCSPDCRKQILWVLSLSRGLLNTFNARYASFSFNSRHVFLDILPSWAKDISRFTGTRQSGNKPADDLKGLILDSGKNWYHIIENNNSRSYASLFLLRKNSDRAIPFESIRPGNRQKPRLSRKEKESLKLLRLEINELIEGERKSKIKSAYKKMALIHHPDVGGDAEQFKKVNAAREQMLIWAENPNYTSRRALADCWSYDASTNRWVPPL